MNWFNDLPTAIWVEHEKVIHALNKMSDWELLGCLSDKKSYTLFGETSWLAEVVYAVAKKIGVTVVSKDDIDIIADEQDRLELFVSLYNAEWDHDNVYIVSDAICELHKALGELDEPFTKLQATELYYKLTD
jgi:hypothetical protein